MKGNIQKQMEEITENHPNSEKERIGGGAERRAYSHNHSKGEERRGDKDRVNKFGSCLNRRTSP